MPASCGRGTEIPYVAHLLAVVGIALEHGATEDEAIGALLRDASEDAGGTERIDDIRLRFSPLVAALVEGCTDTVCTPKPPWRARKEVYIVRRRFPAESVIRHNRRNIRLIFKATDEWSRTRCCQHTFSAPWPAGDSLRAMCDRRVEIFFSGNRRKTASLPAVTSVSLDWCRERGRHDW